MRKPTVAIAIVCKTPIAGVSKTRLSPPLKPEAAAELSACFIRDVARTVESVVRDGDVTGYACYTPLGSESDLRALLPDGFELLLQGEGDLGERFKQAIAELLAAGHSAAILLNSDSPTLPRSILRAAADAVRTGNCAVLGPALDGGYTLIGLSKPHARMFEDIPWSTDTVHRLTLERAREIALPVIEVAKWYDVDDGASLQMLEAELRGQRPGFLKADLVGEDAPASRQALARLGRLSR